MSRGALLISLMLHAAALTLLARWVTPPALPGDLHDQGTSSSFVAEADGSLVLNEPSPAVPPIPEAEPLPPQLFPPSVNVFATVRSSFHSEIVVPNGSAATALDVSPTKNRRAAHTSSRAARSGSGSRGSGAGAGGDGHGYLPPQFLVRNKPPYPAAARAQRVEGTVLLLVEVGSTGCVAGATVRRTSGHALLDRAALDAVRSWRFEPARENGVAVSACVEIPIRFQLG